MQCGYRYSEANALTFSTTCHCIADHCASNFIADTLADTLANTLAE